MPLLQFTYDQAPWSSCRQPHVTQRSGSPCGCPSAHTTRYKPEADMFGHARLMMTTCLRDVSYVHWSRGKPCRYVG
ncbi:hypothetical protein KDA_10560 [Dictyobacter alpinus]|uniref:Uncharacterized protein n=1 Tax=Dictyobacter alpinus TaxID=2014873 RepID=A0A402B2J2_9CHLR|nr:hypothetical protein KDA_10560 [Dictyobacter alpinus]